MQITYLGHAGFIAETDAAIVITDPWLSSTGAFDASWFQLPRNHHLAPLVYEKLGDQSRSIYLYVSHEHQDHFDIEFLNSLPERKFTLLIPEFSRSALMNHFSNYKCEEIIFFHHKQRIAIPGGFLKFYVDDSHLNRDSAILVNAGDTAFFDMNDCKLFDILPEIVREDGPINIFTCQFSGATWHPTCYDYPKSKYERLSAEKSSAKFESVAKAIELIRPGTYIPSAGPVCFLDPALSHLNTQPINIFPRAAKVITYLKARLRELPVFIPEMMPGDVLDADSSKIVALAEQRFNEETAGAYIADYAASFSKLFEDRRALQEGIDEQRIVTALQLELERKLKFLSLADRVTVPLYIRLNGTDKLTLRTDFERKVVEHVSAKRDLSCYEIDAPAWQIAKILDRELTWEEFSLTFRARLKRIPDVYDPVLHAFLVMEAEDIGKYCDLLLEIEGQEQRTIVEADGKKYSVRRYCPHQGGDLSCGWMEEDRFLVCPRHRWHFDILQGGQCTSNAASIGAVCLEQKADIFGEREEPQMAITEPAVSN
jgi:UDP-MurNAc hydroxylase